MKRYFSPNLESGQLSPEESRHCLQVLRQKKGELCTVFDGKGREWKVEIIETSKDSVTYKKIAESVSPPVTKKIILAQAITKPKSMDFIIQKATELGVYQIAPLLSDRTVSRLEEEQAEGRVEKWKHTAIEAAKQCGQNRLPTILPVCPPRQFVNESYPKALKLLASLQPEARPLKQTLREHLQSNPNINEIVLMVGPEGDYSPAEVGAARSAGYLPISLGSIILRAETAALFCLSAISYEFSGS